MITVLVVKFALHCHIDVYISSSILILLGAINTNCNNSQFVSVAAVNRLALMSDLMKPGSLYLGMYWCMFGPVFGYVLVYVWSCIWVCTGVCLVLYLGMYWCMFAYVSLISYSNLYFRNTCMGCVKFMICHRGIFCNDALYKFTFTCDRYFV